MNSFLLFLKELWSDLVFISENGKDTLDTPVLPPKSPVDVPKLPDVPNVPKRDLLNEFCLAIQSREGHIAPCPQFPKGTPAWRNKNPGNIKGLDGKFLVFPSYEAGFAYLKEYVKRVALNKHTAYPKNCTIEQFFAVYAPASDNNEPLSYALEVANKLKVGLIFRISDLI